MPSDDQTFSFIVELEEESFEEVDHLDAFKRLRCTSPDSPHLPDVSGQYCSGFQSDRLNCSLSLASWQSILGSILSTSSSSLGSQHGLQPFENVAQFDEAPKWVSQVSHLHRLDESRHMATTLQIAKLSKEFSAQQIRNLEGCSSLP